MLGIEKLFMYFSTPYWSGVATTLAILGALGTLFTVLARRREKIYYEITDTPLVIDPEISGVNVSVNCGQIVGKSLFRRVVFIVNKRSGAIDHTNFVGSPFSFRRTGGIVYIARQIPEATTCSFELTVEEESVKITALECPRDTGLAIEILHDGCLLSPLSSHPKDDSAPTRYVISKWSLSSSLLSFFLASIIGVLLGIVHSFLPDDKKVNLLGNALVFGPTFLTFLFFLVSRKISDRVQQIVFRSECERAFIRYVRRVRS